MILFTQMYYKVDKNKGFWTESCMSELEPSSSFIYLFARIIC